MAFYSNMLVSTMWKVYKMVKLSFNKPISAISRRFINDRTGLFMAETCARYMDKFIPMDTGALAQNYTPEPFKVTYNVPYAQYIFNGDRMNFQKEKHPQATAHWDKATQSAYSTQIAKEVSEFIKRG